MRLSHAIIHTCTKRTRTRDRLSEAHCRSFSEWEKRVKEKPPFLLPLAFQLVVHHHSAERAYSVLFLHQRVAVVLSASLSAPRAAMIFVRKFADCIVDRAPTSMAAVELPLENRAVFPGDFLQQVSAFERVTLGPGVARDVGDLVATRAGVLRWEATQQRLWVENEQKRYLPALGENVIGVVVDRNADEYRLDLGGAANASLPVLAFDGATKRNRPQLAIGALVYTRVVLANKDMDPEVSCKAPEGVGAAKDWVTKESVYGELPGGHVFDCPQVLCRQLLDADCPVLDALGELGAFEIAIGLNGRVWVDAEKEAMMVLVHMAVLRSQGHAPAEHARLVDALSQGLDL